MKHSPILWSLQLLCGLLCWAAPVDAQDASEEEPPLSTRRALLIGINQYRSEDVPDLRGCVNDIEAMQGVLTSRFGFAPEHVRVLTNEEAGRDSILAAIQRLAEETRPADLAFIHYAGHGAQVLDLDGDEEDGKDETLVPHDGRTEGVADITDDELATLLARFRSEATIVVLDCCHSGTGTRSAAVLARRVGEDPRHELYERKGSATRGVVPLISDRYVLMSGAAHDESALDGPIGGKHHGAFSYALVKSLASARPEATPRELFAGVELELRRLGEEWMIAPMPEPQLEAPAELLSRPLLPRGNGRRNTRLSEVPRFAWVGVSRSPDGGAVFLDARGLGVAPGAIWAIYPPEEKLFRAQAAIATAEVLSLEGMRASVRLRPNGVLVADGSRAIPIAPPAASEEIRVRLLGLTPQRAAALAQALRARLSGLTLVGADDFAHLLVEFDGAECRLFGSDGRARVAAFPCRADELPSERLAMILERCLSTSALVAIDNPSSSMRLEVRAGVAAQDAALFGGGRGIEVVVDGRGSADSGMPVLHTGARDDPRSTDNCLQLSLRASTDCFLTIVDVDAEGAVSLLFPNSYSRPDFYPDGRITGGVWHRIPDSLEDGNRAGFHWRVRPPAGLDTIRVFASTSRAHAEELRRTVRRIEETRSAAIERGVGDGSPASQRGVLSALRHSLATRGITVIDVGATPPAPASGAQVGFPAQAGSGTPSDGSTPQDSAPQGSASQAAPGVYPAVDDWVAVSLTVRIEVP